MILHINRSVCVALFALLTLAACGPGAGDLREGRDPLIRRARDMRTSGQIDSAIRSYNDALDKNGDMAQAHLEIAAIYHQDKRDFVSAIYHYQRFLDLSPSSQKTNLVAAEIRRAKMEFAASLPDRPSDAVQTISTMTKERDLLLTRIKEMQDQVDKMKYEVALANAKAERASASSAKPQTPARAEGSAKSAAPTSTNVSATQRTYVVKPGDTLAKIARDLYRNPEMSHAIFEANKATMKNERDLRSGQKIVLPPGARPDGG